MLKLITILAALIPVILFLRTVFLGKSSRVMSQAATDFKKQIDHLVWAILFLISCGLVYSVGTLIYSMWR